MISMMPDALLARQLRVSGALASRPLKEDHDMLASTTVSQLLAGWARLYGHTPVSATVTYLHLVGILLGGGVAVAADRASLRQIGRAHVELQSPCNLVCRLLLEKKKKITDQKNQISNAPIDNTST